MIVTKVLIDSTEFQDFQNMTVKSSMNEFNSSSSYLVTYDSPFGRHSNDFSVGQEIEIFADDQAITPCDPIAHYKMNDNAANTIVVDTGTGGNNGIASVNTSTLTGVGKINESLVFNGTDEDVDLGTNFEFQTTNFSFGGWIKSDDSNSFALSTRTSFATTGYEILVGPGGTENDIEIRIQGDGAGVKSSPVWSAPNDVFIHVFATVDRSSNELKLYGNGVLIGTTDISSIGNVINVQNLFIAKRSSTFFAGSVDDVRIYQQALTLSEVQAIYNSGNGTEKDCSDQEIIHGIVEKISFNGRGTSQRVTLTGRDFSLRLQDSTVEPVVFTNTEISVIVKAIIADNVDDITVTNVDVTGTTQERISFNHDNVFDALKQLAELAGFYFFVDTNKDLNFKKKDLVSSGITLDNTNIKSTKFNQTREGMANEVFVYGDRYLAGFQETLDFDGGSVFTLISKPHNTLVQISGAPLVGGVLNLISEPTTQQYLVSFDDKQIIFTSGTSAGDNIPVSGTNSSGLITYDRDIPIVKAGRNNASITAFGRKRKIINDKSIKDPTTASDILKKELEKSDPFRGMTIQIKGWLDITVGNTAVVVLDDFGIDDTIGILSVSYKFDKNTVQSEDVINIKFDKKIKDITDEVVSLRQRLDRQESQDRQESDVITRLEQADDTLRIVGSEWLIRTRSATGSAAIYDNAAFGVYSGTGFDVGLYSSGTNAFGPFSTVRSGGFFT